MDVRDLILALLAFGAIAIALRSLQGSLTTTAGRFDSFDDFGEFGFAIDFGGQAPGPDDGPGSGAGGAGFGDLFQQFRGLFGPGGEAPPPETTLAPFQGFEPAPAGAEGPPEVVFTPTVEREVDAVARTIWGEARGEGRAGMEAVANVIMNRVADRRWGGDAADVALAPFQFSAWNTGDPNRALMIGVNENDPNFRTAMDIARRAVAGRLPDRTNGATHFHTSYIARVPSWARAPGARVVARIGGHVFYAGVP